MQVILKGNVSEEAVIGVPNLSLFNQLKSEEGVIILPLSCRYGEIIRIKHLAQGLVRNNKS